MYEELVKGLRKAAYIAKMQGSNPFRFVPYYEKAADAIKELQRICDAMKPKHDAVCIKCAYYAEAEYNGKGFLICPASGMDITAWDFCSYFEPPPGPPKEDKP